MSARDTQVATAAHARAVRSGDPNEILETRRAVAAARLENAVRSIVEAAPPLTVEQRQRIAAILNGGAA